jgi:hypothetical protein
MTFPQPALVLNLDKPRRTALTIREMTTAFDGFPLAAMELWNAELWHKAVK